MVGFKRRLPFGGVALVDHAREVHGPNPSGEPV
jgi:hypothetical protein